MDRKDRNKHKWRSYIEINNYKNMQWVTKIMREKYCGKLKHKRKYTASSRKQRPTA
jgi:hypothetical protein